MKKILLGLGSVAAIVAPVASVVACGAAEAKKVEPTQTQVALGYNLFTLGKLMDGLEVDKTDAEWPVAVEHMVDKEGETEKVPNPVYNIVKVLDAGLTSKSLNDTWPGEVK